jgi:hypothetical protein
LREFAVVAVVEVVVVSLMTKSAELRAALMSPNATVLKSTIMMM